MKSPRFLSLAFVSLALPVLAHAHPGHDGGHVVVGDFGHLANNPHATIACLSLFVAAGWGVRYLLKSRQSAKTERAKRD